MRPMDNVIANGIVQNTILKLEGLEACPLLHGNFSKIKYSEIEFCGNFDHINLPTDRLSNTLNITA